MATVSDINEIANADLTDALQQRIMLIAPSFGWWTGQYQLKDAEVTVNGQTIKSSDITVPRIKLFEQSDGLKLIKNRFQKLASTVSAVKEFYSIGFSIDGIRMIPRASKADFFYELVGKTEGGRPIYDDEREPNRRTGEVVQSVAYQLEEAANDFVNDYDDIMREMRARVGENVWNRIKDRIPKPEKMRTKFYLTFAQIELAGGSAERVLPEDMDAYDEMIRENTARQVHAAVNLMIAGPREELATALHDLQDLINRNGRVTNASFNAARIAIEKIRAFEFVANAELLNQIRVLERRLNVTEPSSLTREVAISDGFTEIIRGVREEALSDVSRAAAAAGFGRNLRGIDLD